MNKQDWTYKKIGDICDIKTGKLDANAASLNGVYPFFTCSKETLCIDRYSYDCECVLIAGNGDLNVKYYNGKFDAYQRTYIVTIKPQYKSISTYYLYKFFCKYIERLRQLSIGGVIKYIKLGNLTDACIPVPPIGEQERIVAELDLLQGIIEKKKEQLKAYDQLAQSIFYTMFGDPIDNPKGWETKKLRDVCHHITDGDHMPPPKSDNGIPFLTISNVNKDKQELDFSNTFFVPQEYYDNLKDERKARINDMLYTVTGSYGIPVIVRTSRPFCFQRHIALLKPIQEKVLTSFLFYWALCPSIKEEADSVATGIAQKTVGLNSLRQFNVILPPLSLQEEFAEKVEAIERQKALVQQSIEETQTMFDCTMDKYFG